MIACLEGLEALNYEMPDELKIQPGSTTPVKQQSLSKGLDSADHKAFFDQLNVSDQIAINSEMLTGASDFLEATPNSEFPCSRSPVYAASALPMIS